MTDHEFKGYALVLKSGADPTTGGVAIAGFTTAGMVGVIAASHIIRTLKLNQLGTVLNADFPAVALIQDEVCLLYTSPSPRDRSLSRMPSSA